MEFEFDPAKSAGNRRKHGLDFIGAQALWRDPSLLVLLPRDEDGEERRMAIGLLDGAYWGGDIRLSRRYGADHFRASCPQAGGGNL